MALRIEISADHMVEKECGLAMNVQVEQALGAIGFWRPAYDAPRAELSTVSARINEALKAAPDLSNAGATEVQMRAQEQRGATPDQMEAEARVTTRKRRTKAEIEAERNAQQISTQPENRVDPETAAQDAADEKAETATATELSHDDVRHALGRYVKLFGLDAAQEDGPKLLKILFGDEAGKVSDIPKDQASLQKVLSGIDEMIEKNPFKRTPTE